MKFPIAALASASSPPGRQLAGQCLASVPQARPSASQQFSQVSMGNFNEVYSDSEDESERTGVFIRDEKYFDGNGATGTGRYDVDFHFTGNEARSACTWYKFEGNDRPFNLFELGGGSCYGRFAHGRWTTWYGGSGYVTHTWCHYPYTRGNDDEGNPLVPTLDTDCWHHACVTWDGSTMRAYHDGAYAGDYTYNHGPMNTGNSYNYWGSHDSRFHFKGWQQGLLLIKGSALTLEEIEAITIGASPPSSAPENWNITFTSVTADFNFGSTQDVKVEYQIGSGREFDFALYAGGCETIISDNTAIEGINFNVTNTTVPADGDMNNLTLAYNFDMANLTSSNILSVEDNRTKIALCQVLQLTIDNPNGGADMVITEDFRDIMVDLDLGVDFSIEDGVDLAQGTVEALQDKQTFVEFISAIKCTGLGTEEDTTALDPNTELSVCVRSDSTEVEIEEIVSMFIDGIDPNEVSQTLPVIEGGRASVDSLTFVERADNNLEASITTRVPFNLFDFDATDANIAVRGSLTLKFVDGTRRKLAVGGLFGRTLQGDAVKSDEEAAFELDVKLQPEGGMGADLAEEGGAIIGNSADATIVGKGAAAFAVVFASAYVMVW